MRGGYVFHGDRILETDPTGLRIGENLRWSFYGYEFPLSVGNVSLLFACMVIDNPCASDFPDTATVEENGPQSCVFEIDGDIPSELQD